MSCQKKGMKEFRAAFVDGQFPCPGNTKKGYLLLAISVVLSVNRHLRI
jgi:hypothetical protein